MFKIWIWKKLINSKQLYFLFINNHSPNQFSFIKKFLLIIIKREELSKLIFYWINENENYYYYYYYYYYYRTEKNNPKHICIVNVEVKENNVYHYVKLIIMEHN